MYKCAIYIRVSTNRDEQKLSLKNQQDLFVNYISSKGWSVYKFYVDINSGTNAKRVELQNLIADAEERKFDVILSKELSRLARNSELSHRIKRIADDNNIHIITLDGAINTLTGNRAMFGMYAWIYEQESQRTSERIKYSLSSRCRRGLFKGSIPPYGYICRNGKLYPRNDFTVDIVKRIFKDYISGKGFDRIARELYEDGIPSPSQISKKINASPMWHGSGVRNILENPHYVGDLVQSRTSVICVTSKKRHLNNENEFITVENTHDGIISKEDFKLVQDIIKSRRKIRPNQNIHLFTNVLFCKDCMHGMHFKKNRKGYICGNYNKHGSKICSDHIIREDALSLQVLNEISKVITNVKLDNSYTKLRENLLRNKNSIKRKYNSVLEELDSFKQKKSKALHLLIESKITKEDYDLFINDVDSNIRTISQKLEDYNSILNDEFSNQLFNELNYIRNSNFDLSKLNKELLNKFIDKILVAKDGTAEIIFRFPQLSSF